MKTLGESVAAECRYGDNALDVFGRDAELIFEDSKADYQGHANILVRTADGRFAHCEWTYGSCSGCDEWSDRDLTDEQIDTIMRDTAAWFDDAEALVRYLRLEEPERKYPTDQSPTAGSIPGMIRFLGSGIADEFKAMGNAFVAWQTAKRRTLQ